VVPQLCSGWQHNYSTKTRQAGRANEQSMYSFMSMIDVEESLQTLMTECQGGLNHIFGFRKCLKLL